ncbi:MAG: hypothetical protein DDT25_01099 [Chloroflexi bacterium]|nr:hypothetical protein [Chloroflexota bacterium]
MSGNALGTIYSYANSEAGPDNITTPADESKARCRRGSEGDHRPRKIPLSRLGRSETNRAAGGRINNHREEISCRRRNYDRRKMSGNALGTIHSYANSGVGPDNITTPADESKARRRRGSEGDHRPRKIPLGRLGRAEANRAAGGRINNHREEISCRRWNYDRRKMSGDALGTVHSYANSGGGAGSIVAPMAEGETGSRRGSEGDLRPRKIPLGRLGRSQAHRPAVGRINGNRQGIISWHYYP